MNRKAISSLVATVLLVLITIAAVGIIWGAIMPMIKSNLETSQKCNNAEITINIDGGYTYASGNDAFIQVSRGPSSSVNVVGIQLKVIDNTGNSVTQTNSTPNANSDNVYKITATATPKRVGVAPIIGVGNLNTTCPMKEYDLKA